ncbi:MAG: carboxypeptidase-like regulatory domain-containing protein, partial [Terriglobia bacterium]
MRTSLLRTLLLSATIGVLTVALVPTPLHAQATGEILGTVTDPSGAVVPGVTVTATRTATGISRSTVTSATGTYTLARLLVGTYTVTAKSNGFKAGMAQD